VTGATAASRSWGPCSGAPSTRSRRARAPPTRVPPARAVGRLPCPPARRAVRSGRSGRGGAAPSLWVQGANVTPRVRRGTPSSSWTSRASCGGRGCPSTRRSARAASCPACSPRGRPLGGPRPLAQVILVSWTLARPGGGPRPPPAAPPLRTRAGGAGGGASEGLPAAAGAGRAGPDPGGFRGGARFAILRSATARLGVDLACSTEDP